MQEQTVLLKKIDQLSEELTHSREQSDALAALLASRDAQISRMRARMDELLKRIYGRRSEKLDPCQLLMQEILLEADSAKNCKGAASQAETLSEREGVTVRSHTRRKRKRLEAPEHWERVDHEMDVAEADKTCGCCGTGMDRIGEDITERLDYQPIQMKVNRYIRPKYACKNGDCTEGKIKQVEAPGGPIGRCEAESSLLAHIIVEKFEHHTPLYRQQIRFERLGLDLARMTMSEWLAKCAYVLKPLYELLRENILSGDVVLNDDTPVDMLEPRAGGTRTARLWCTVGGPRLEHIIYNFTRTRGREGPLEFFKGYKGYLVTDAYAGYDPLFENEEIIHSGCWAHARRYFIKARDSEPRLSTEILVLIARLYRVEDDCKHRSAAERLKARQKQSVRILDKIKTKLEEQRLTVLPRSAQGEAVEYSLRQWKSLMIYTTDGRLPIDNNRAEQGIRPVALGRKNWLFVGSENGGHTAAVLMSFCATCRKLKINTWEYLKDVLDRINDHKMNRLAELLPDNWQRLRAGNKEN
jgi:transposase